MTPANAISSFCISDAYVAASPAKLTVSIAAPNPAPIATPAGPPTAPPAKASWPVEPSPAVAVPANAPSAALPPTGIFLNLAFYLWNIPP